MLYYGLGNWFPVAAAMKYLDVGVDKERDLDITDIWEDNEDMIDDLFSFMDYLSFSEEIKKIVNKRLPRLYDVSVYAYPEKVSALVKTVVDEKSFTVVCKHKLKIDIYELNCQTAQAKKFYIANEIQRLIRRELDRKYDS